MCITPFHFLHSLTSMGLVYEDDSLSVPKGSKTQETERVLERVRFHAESFLDQWLKKSWCILYKSLRRYRPSVVAICCILAARRTVGVIPILSERLKEMALLEECFDEGVFEEIGECYEAVCNLEGRKKTASLFLSSKK